MAIITVVTVVSAGIDGDADMDMGQIFSTEPNRIHLTELQTQPMILTQEPTPPNT